jgi:RND family efflux transporter MFP subunit
MKQNMSNIQRDEMKIHRLILMFGILAAGVSFTGCSGNNNETPLKDKAVAVEVAPVSFSDGKGALLYSGTIEESETIPLSFSEIGTVSRVYVQEGQAVKKGQLLAELNDETYRNAYDVSLATERQAQDAYNRLLPMHNNGTLPEIKFIEAETALQQAKSSSAISKKSLRDCKLYSPTDGIVGKKAIDPGMTAMASFSSITIVKIQKVYATVSVPENEISSVKKGDKASVTISALNNSGFTGTVEEIGVVADPISHTYKIKIALNNSDAKIKPGMICSVNMLRENSQMKLMVPFRAVTVDENGCSFVYAVNNEKNEVSLTQIKTGALFNNGIEVVSGVKNGDLVVTSGQQKLSDKSLIRIVNN